MGFDDGGQSLADIKRGGPITAEHEKVMRRMVADHAENADDESLLLAVLGFKPKDVIEPPDERCAAPSCGRSMWRKNWPRAWRAGRTMYGSEGKCVGCRRRERVATGQSTPKKRSKGKAYQRKTG